VSIYPRVRARHRLQRAAAAHVRAAILHYVAGRACFICGGKSLCRHRERGVLLAEAERECARMKGAKRQ